MGNLKGLSFTGALAFIVDIITLVTYLTVPTFERPELNVILFVLAIYSWTALSWYFIRKGFINGIANNRIQRRIPVIRRAVFGFGLTTFLLTAVLTYVTAEPFAFIHIGFVPLVYAGLYYLLPVVHEDMRIYITRVGGYVVRHDI